MISVVNMTMIIKGDEGLIEEVNSLILIISLI